MTTPRSRTRHSKLRTTKRYITHKQLEAWFQEVLPRNAAQPSKEQLYKLADGLRVLLNRADNAERTRQGPVSLSEQKDVSPGAEADRRLNAVVNAIRDFEDYLGPYLRVAKKLDIYLPEFEQTLRMVRLLYLPQASPRSSRGKPPAPWKDAGRRFAELVRKLLKENEVRGKLTLANPSSYPIVIATNAINSAYGTNISPEGFISALRPRYRAKRKKL